jgi:hypothetical protein
MRTTVGVLGLAAMLLGCQAPLPEPDSPAAKLYAERCSNKCHRAYAPGTLKYEMWKYQVGRMENDIARAGLPPLTAQERATILDYLKRHSG